MRIYLLSCHNQYDAKRYFTKKLSEALQRIGITTEIMSWDRGPLPASIVDRILQDKPDLTCSFHQLPPQSDGGYFWDRLKLPHWTIVIDPIFYDLELMSSPYSVISCVDRFDCDLLHSLHFDQMFFFPHAVERELIQPIGDISKRPMDLIFLGSCYDPYGLYAHWKKEFSKEIINALEEAVDLVLSERHIHFLNATIEALTTNGISISEVPFNRLASYVDAYSRGIDRLLLIRSITDVPLHVFGGKCWREENPIMDWTYYLSKQSNVIVHESVSYPDSLQLMKQSKICLNSIPFFKEGSHDRVFTSLACGALPLTSSNLYLTEVFGENDLLFYQPTAFEAVNDQVVSLLNQPDDLAHRINSGQQKVAKGHTWDHRLSTLFQEGSIFEMLNIHQS